MCRSRSVACKSHGFFYRHGLERALERCAANFSLGLEREWDRLAWTHKCRGGAFHSYHNSLPHEEVRAVANISELCAPARLRAVLRQFDPVLEASCRGQTMGLFSQAVRHRLAQNGLCPS